MNLVAKAGRCFNHERPRPEARAQRALSLRVGPGPGPGYRPVRACLPAPDSESESELRQPRPGKAPGGSHAGHLAGGGLLLALGTGSNARLTPGGGNSPPGPAGAARWAAGESSWNRRNRSIRIMMLTSQNARAAAAEPRRA
jgi:hypothetical protein